MEKKMFDQLLQSVKQMDAIRRGNSKSSRVFELPDPDVAAIRSQTGLSQVRFARLIGVSPGTLRNWEQKRREPTGAAKSLFRIIASDPESAIKALYPKQAG